MAVRPSSCPSCGLVLPEGAKDCPQCSAQTVDLRTPFPPISGYKMVHALGEGGMGAVYLAQDETLGRRVAVKVISRRYASDAESSARFLREARSMATVEHPHIVRVYAFGESEGQAYLVMEYVEGEDLAQSVKRRGPHSASEALRIVRQVVEALEAAWEQNIVHRDIKPSNILLDKRGRVRVADFGLAKPMRMEGDATLSAKTYVLGTPHYAAPEQIRGRDVDFRSDIYSLGIVLYEMLAGERPFEGSTPFDVIEKQVREPLPALKKKRPDTPEEVVQLLDWMTQKDPAQRPASYTALLERINAMLGGLPATPAPSGVATPAPQERPRLYPVFVALAVLAVAAAGWFAWTMLSAPFSHSPVRSSKQLVVAVTPFYGPDEDSLKEGKVMAALVEKAITQKRGKQDAKVLGVEETKLPVRDHQAARALGERLGANVVVWGEAFTLRGETELQPYFTMVPSKQQAAAKQSAAEQRTLLGKDPLAALQEQSAQATVVQATAPNQIQLRKTTAEGAGEMAMFLAGLHALYTEDQPEKALSYFESAPRTAESLRYRGEALIRVYRNDEAAALLREAVKLDPRSAPAQALLGDLEVEAGHFKEAVAAYRAGAQSGGEYSARNGLFYRESLYAVEFRSVSWGSGRMKLPYLLRIEPKSGRVLERHLLPGSASAFRPKDAGFEIEYEYGNRRSATLYFAAGKFDRPVQLAILWERRSVSSAGAELAGNFETDFERRRKERPSRFAKSVNTRYPNQDQPTTIEGLEAAARAAIERDATQPRYLYVLGQALWAQERKDEAEKVWTRMLGEEFPAIPYYAFTGMAADFEKLGQRDWADRTFAEGLRRRRQMSQPIATCILWERLISAGVAFEVAQESREGRNLDRVYEWLKRVRELTGWSMEGENLGAAAWEKYFRSRGENDKAQKEAALRALVNDHPASSAVFVRVDLALYAAGAFALGALGLLALIGIRAFARCRVPGVQDEMETPGARRKATWAPLMHVARVLWLAFLLGAELSLAALEVLAIVDHKPVGMALAAVGMIFVGLLLFRRRRPRRFSIPSPVRLLAATTRRERAVLGASLAGVLVSYGALIYHITALSAVVGLPLMMDSVGSPEFTRTVENNLKELNTASRRFAVAVASHLAGNTARARELYQSLPADRRAQQNLAALQAGNLTPPVALTLQDVYDAAMDKSFQDWLRHIWAPFGELAQVFQLRGDRIMPLLIAVTRLPQIALVLAILLVWGFWKIPARASEKDSSTGDRIGWAGRVCYSLLPGAFDLRQGFVWRGHVALCVVGLLLLIGLHLALDGSTSAPGPVSAATSPFLLYSYPLPTPPGLPNGDAVEAYHFWTFFWAYPYARVFWPLVGLAALFVLVMHITRLRAIWRA